MGLLEVDVVRAPLLSLESQARDELSATLRSLGVVESSGGRIDRAGAATRAAVA
jgi:hypothetical protein